MRLTNPFCVKCQKRVPQLFQTNDARGLTFIAKCHGEEESVTVPREFLQGAGRVLVDASGFVFGSKETAIVKTK